MIKTTPGQIPVLNEVLIEVLVCPLDQSDLEQQGSDLVCVTCARRYPVANGIPNMLVDPE